MLVLYVKTGCPYCARVLAKLGELGVPFEEKNVSVKENLDELIQKGGKPQTPFLVDTTNHVVMYESGDIVQYLDDTYKSKDNPER